MRATRTGCLLLLILLVAAAVAEAQQSQTAERRPRRSWTADRREFGVGQVLTVLIDEYTLASANKTNTARDLRRRDMSLDVGGSGMAASLPPTGLGVGSINDADSRQLGDAIRQNRFQGEMTVRVTSVEEGGLLRVEGKKLVNVDRNREELSFTGLIRPEDVSARNVVDSWRVADAEMVYTSNGKLGKPSGGMIGRLIGAFWP